MHNCIQSTEIVYSDIDNSKFYFYNYIINEMELDIKDLEAQEKKNNIKTKINESKMKENLKPKKKFKLVLGKPQNPVKVPNFILQEQFNEQKIQLEEQKNADKETSTSCKNVCLHLLSRPIHPTKREVLKENLKSSDFINHYLDKNIFFRFLDNVSDDVKFLLIYGENYIKSLN